MICEQGTQATIHLLRKNDWFSLKCLLFSHSLLSQWQSYPLFPLQSLIMCVSASSGLRARERTFSLIYKTADTILRAGAPGARPWRKEKSSKIFQEYIPWVRNLKMYHRYIFSNYKTLLLDNSPQSQTRGSLEIRIEAKSWGPNQEIKKRSRERSWFEI